jgi:hypothetical protein
MTAVADDLLNVLGRFHRDVLMPEVKAAIQESERRLRDTTLSHFDAIYRRFDRLEIEYHALAAAVGRVELRLGSADRDP